MKVVRTLFILVVLAASFVVMAATEALACSCVPPRPDHKAIKDASAVFTGTLIATEPGVEIGFDEVTWTFAVDTVYKGDLTDSQDIRSPTQSAACGLTFKEEKRYAVFAYAGEEDAVSDDNLFTNSCMNTRPLGDGKDLKLEPIRAFEGAADVPHGDVQTKIPWWQLVLGSIAFVALILGVLAVFRRG